jgi:hypothetical protein
VATSSIAAELTVVNRSGKVSYRPPTTASEHPHCSRMSTSVFVPLHEELIKVAVATRWEWLPAVKV